MMEFLGALFISIWAEKWTLFSLSFFIFLAGAVLVYYLVPWSKRWIVLLGASLVFYCCAGTVITIVYVIVSIVVSWLAGCLMADWRRAGKDERQVKRIFIAALLCNLAILVALKYLNFILGNAGAIVSLFSGQSVSWQSNLLASLGVSFYTLQIVGYLCDCYWERIEPERNCAKVALFTAFFPQMVSGPISRFDQLGAELFPTEEKEQNVRDDILCGVIRICVGLFKKFVIAENFACLVTFFLAESEYSYGIFAIAGVFCYVVEIYADFAGCMDIVLGAAKCFGITMVENFDRPFSSVTIQEFWQRWHITLGQWLKDYVMYPLLRSKLFARLNKKLKNLIGKKSAQKCTTYLAMLVLWFCMGLWHGGGWNYIAEGVWFWLAIVAGQMTAPFFTDTVKTLGKTGRAMTLFRQARTACVYAVGLVFFRATSVGAALRLLRDALHPRNLILSVHNIWACLSDIKSFELSDGTSVLGVLFNTVLGFIFFQILCFAERKRPLHRRMLGHTCVAQVAVALVFLYLILLLGVWGSGYSPSAFIYGEF